MRRIETLLRTAVVVIGALLLVAAGPGPSAVGSAAATVDAFHAALAKGDASAAAELLADDALIFEEGEAETSKAQYVGGHLAADIAFMHEMRETTLARWGSEGADLAWVATEGQTQGSYKGKTFNRIGTETMILRKAAGVWRITHIHWSSRAAEVK